MAVVTISRGLGSEGHTLATGLAEKLGYEVVSREDVVGAAARYGVPEARLQEALLEAPTFWDRLTLGRARYLAFVRAALCERAVQDRIVYEGNAGHLLLRGVPHVVCIRILAPVSHRVEVAKQRFGMTDDEAARHVENADRQRESWAQNLYGADCWDPALFDLVVNLRTLSVAGAVDAAATVVSRPEFAPNDASRKAMSDLLLESRVSAALAADADTLSAEVRVQADGGVVTLHGRASMVDAVIAVARGVEGVTKVDHLDLAAPEYTV